jgi:hypothetical protein
MKSLLHAGIEEVGHSFIIVKNRQILSKDAVEILKDGVICCDIWNPVVVFFLFIL